MIKLPKGKEHLWPCYRPILAGYATWDEVANKMSICQLFDLNDFITAYEKAGGGQKL